MDKISEAILKEAYKPYDIVTDKEGNVGFIRETDIRQHSAAYDVEWIVGTGEKNAWYNHSELKKHCNFFVKIAECACNHFSNNREKVKTLMATGI